MFRTALVSIAFLATLVVPAAAEETPEEAVITATEALVRSGPSSEFYPTGRLASGERVEIYHRQDNGWCAIRPPQGSFSYVRADHVRPTEVAEILEVTQAGTKTRVGSSLKSAYQVEYVALKAGERLQMLEGPVRLPRNRHTWYRVAPPSGEFRWVRSRDLQAEGEVRPASADLALPAATVPAPVPPSEPPPTRQEAPESAAAPEIASTAAPSTAAPSTPGSDGIAFEKLAPRGGKMTTEPIQERHAPEGPSIALAAHTERLGTSGSSQGNVAAEPSAWTAVAATPLADRSGGAERPEAAGTSTTVSDPDLRLSELELSLSRMVTQEVDRWNLDPLRQQVHDVFAYLPDESGRRSAQQLLQRIEEFAVLQRRHRDLATPSAADRAREISLTAALSQRSTSGGLAPPMAHLPPDPPHDFAAREAAIRRQAADVHYAGQGYLVPVISSQPNMPRFALTDAQGSILAFVSPRPGLNLRRYQRREVGIVGRETSRTDEQAPHLVADRVVVLDRRSR